MAKYLTEFIGTFFLVLTVGLAVLSGSAVAVLAIGVILMCMVYMGGHVSGGHYNPAVTLSVFMRGALEGKEVAPYMLSQILGGLAASLAVLGILGKTFAPAPGPNIGPGAALSLEVLYTFALALVVLNAATSKKTQGNSFYGLAIGFTIVAAAFAGGPVSGGAFNPAVGLGPVMVNAIAGGGSMANLWLYLVGPFAGGALAALVFRLQEGEDSPGTKA